MIKVKDVHLLDKTCTSFSLFPYIFWVKDVHLLKKRSARKEKAFGWNYKREAVAVESIRYNKSNGIEI